MENINPELIATCAHEAGHYICFIKYGINCEYPVVQNSRSAHPAGYVTLERMPYTDKRIIDDMVATLAGQAAQARAIRKYDLRIPLERGCDTDFRHVRKFKHLTEKSFGYLKSKARARVLAHGKEIDVVTNELLRRYAPK